MPNWVQNNLTIKGDSEIVATCLEWCCCNWGTEWNASEVGIFNTGDEAIFYFQTTRDYAASFVKRLSKKFPDLSFTISFADEDLGDNCGEFTFINGIEQPDGFYYDYSDWKDNPELKREAIAFACNVLGYDPEEYLEDENNEEE